MFIQEFYSNIHGVDTTVPKFITTFKSTHIVVTPDLISEVLHVPRIVHPDYPGCTRLQTVSKDKLLSHFYERPSIWGGKQNTSCTNFAKGSHFLNMVMTFTLTPLSHYNSVTESRARFLLSLLEDLTIDFLSHFITSVLDVYQDMATRDKFIFPSTITRTLRHFSVKIPNSPHLFPTMGGIDTVTVRQNEAQLQPKWPHMETSSPIASTVPSTSAPSSSSGDVTLEAIMAQLQRMDAHLDTLTDELCQVNTHVGHIARRQAQLGGFIPSLAFSRGFGK